MPQISGRFAAFGGGVHLCLIGKLNYKVGGGGAEEVIYS